MMRVEQKVRALSEWV